MNEDAQETTGGSPADADDLEKASLDTVDAVGQRTKHAMTRIG